MTRLFLVSAMRRKKSNLKRNLARLDRPILAAVGCVKFHMMDFPKDPNNYFVCFGGQIFSESAAST